ncbi:hypothetical protein SCORR_v1c03480 [Spiroplasma corruscae]|uniref:YitT family protein n=1 Tax=Spiroplasma corruscae TaxID=216934 RepID=A0A222ENQ5_9MOLU|nr:YitT family ABC transporter [Spiroplasma corruscae]ASP28122.1 hypothetical protein SCORR_v1c03480 [Spiroplasma corruscae]
MSNGMNTSDTEVTVEVDNNAVNVEEHIKPVSKKNKIDKKTAKTLLLKDDQEHLFYIENKIISKKEQTLLVQEYFKKRFIKEFFMIALSSLLITIAFDYFVTPTGRTGLFPAGIGALARFFSILSFQNDRHMQGSFYFIYYFTINTPLFIFGFYKLGKKFTYTTTVYIVLQIAFDQFFQNMPFINPIEFNFIVNFYQLNSMPNALNTSIWLFIFAAIAGAILGVAYSLVYRVGSSTGGLDFITIYYSNKTNKSVGSINRNVNLIILGTIIILNTLILPVSQINSDIKMSVLKGLSIEEANNNGLLDQMWKFAQNVNQVSPDFQMQQILDKYSNTATASMSIDDFKYLAEFVSKHNFDGDIPTLLVVKMKVLFIFGPSLFASIVLVLTAGMTTNAMYPKFKVRTFMITTNMPKEINKLLVEKGYQNDILNWDTTNRINGNYLHRSLVMVAMTVLNWQQVEKEIFLIDPESKVTILKTKKVKGIFKYDIKTNEARDFVTHKVRNNEKELEKIKQIAIVRLNKENEKINKRNKRITKSKSKSPNN